MKLIYFCKKKNNPMKKIILATFFIVFFASSCSKNDDETTNTEQNLNNSIAYFQFELNNNPFLYIQQNSTSPSFMNEYGHAYSISMDPYYRVYSYSSEMYKFNYTTSEAIGLDFDNLFKSSDPDEETNNFFSIFKNKPTNFLSMNNSYDKGITVNFIDKNGNDFSTRYGEQNNSVINYNSATESTSNGYKRVVITGTINCKLYNVVDTNQILNLTNGKFKLLFVESNL